MLQDPINMLSESDKFKSSKMVLHLKIVWQGWQGGYVDLVAGVEEVRLGGLVGGWLCFADFAGSAQSVFGRVGM